MAATSGMVKFTYIPTNKKSSYFATTTVDGKTIYNGALNNDVTGVDNTYIIFIGDTGELWTQGNFYGFTSEEKTTINGNFTELANRINSYVNAIGTGTGSSSKTITGASLTNTTGGGKTLTFTYSDISLSISASGEPGATGSSVVKTISQGTNGISYTVGTLGAGDIAYTYTGSAGSPTVASALQELFAWQKGAVDQHLAGVRNVWASAATVTQAGTAQASNINATKSETYKYPFVEFKVEKASGSYDYLYLAADDLLNEIDGTTPTDKDKLKVTVDETSGKHEIGVEVGSGGLKATSSYIGTAQNATSDTTYYSTIAADTNVESAISTLNKAIKTVSTDTTVVHKVNNISPTNGNVNLPLTAITGGAIASNAVGSTAYVNISAVTYGEAITILDKALMKVAQSTSAYANAVTSVDGKTGAVVLQTTPAVDGQKTSTGSTSYVSIAANTGYGDAIAKLNKAISDAYNGVYASSVATSEAYTTNALSWIIVS